LTDCVRTGRSAETLGPGWVNAFIAAMDRGAKERVGVVVEAIGTGGIKRMLDLGGGSGAFSLAFARAIPELKAEILDFSDVIPLTEENIRKAGLVDRVTARIGDVLHDPLGENYDLILASQVTHAFSAEENRELFQRTYHALAPKGRMVVQDFILNPSKTAPRAAALFSLNMLAGSRAGGSYSEPEYTSWMQSAGFADVRRLSPSGLMVGVRA
jgi:cyclopropane fatty-acyl-phospholipid synthase-like methyltransferase